jgi:hypothetical protein
MERGIYLPAASNIQIVLYWRKISGRTFSFRNGCTFVSKIVKSPSPHMELGLNCCSQVCNTTASSVGAVLLLRGYRRSSRRSCAVPAPLRIRHCAPSAALGSPPPRRRRRRIAPQRSRPDVAAAPSPPLHRRNDTGRRGATLDTPVRALRRPRVSAASLAPPSDHPHRSTASAAAALREFGRNTSNWLSSPEASPERDRPGILKYELV